MHNRATMFAMNRVSKIYQPHIICAINVAFTSPSDAIFLPPNIFAAIQIETTVILPPFKTTRNRLSLPTITMESSSGEGSFMVLKLRFPADDTHAINSTYRHLPPFPSIHISLTHRIVQGHFLSTPVQHPTCIIGDQVVNQESKDLHLDHAMFVAITPAFSSLCDALTQMQVEPSLHNNIVKHILYFVEMQLFPLMSIHIGIPLIVEIDYIVTMDIHDMRHHGMPLLEKTVVSGEKERCAVCMEDMEVGTQNARLSCLHIFHGDCILQWLMRNNTCPLCRSNLFTPHHHL